MRARSGGTAAAGRARSGWPCSPPRSFAEGFSFGASRLVHLDRLGTDPGALLFGAEMLLGLALPAILLRRGERIRGYVAMAALAIVAALAIGPSRRSSVGWRIVSEAGVGPGRPA